MRLSDFLYGVGHPVVVYPRLAKCVGGLKAAVLLCQFFYWHDKSAHNDGWVYKTQQDIEEETGLSSDEQRAARAHLKARGVLEERYERLVHRLYFRVNLEALDTVWQQWFYQQSRGEKPSFPKRENPTSGRGEIPLREPENPPSRTGKILPRQQGKSQFVNTETTTEITQENTNREKTRGRVRVKSAHRPGCARETRTHAPARLPSSVDEKFASSVDNRALASQPPVPPRLPMSRERRLSRDVVRTPPQRAP